MLSFEDVVAAQERVMGVARHTPLEYSYAFSEMTDAEVYLKLENFQRTGAFKIRGAMNRIETLSEGAKTAGVVTASAGNHAQGVALAATTEGVDAKVVMPEQAPISKIKATRGYGAEVVLAGADYDAAAEHAHRIEREEGRTYIHAFDDYDVMAGQGTIGLEIAEALPAVETVVVPVGGGGLISGIATVMDSETDARVIGVQAEGASAVAESLRKGERVEREQVDTIADGIAVRRTGEHTLPIIREHVDEVVTVTDAETAGALVALLERSKTLVEGAGAVSLAALLERAFGFEDDETVVAALCGGNIDLNVLTTVIMRGLVESGRYLRLRTVLKDRPGALQQLIDVIADARANIYAIQHDRTSRDIEMNAADVKLDLETRGHEHVVELVDALEAHGYEVDILV